MSEFKDYYKGQYFHFTIEKIRAKPFTSTWFGPTTLVDDSGRQHDISSEHHYISDSFEKTKDMMVNYWTTELYQSCSKLCRIQQALSNCTQLTKQEVREISKY